MKLLIIDSDTGIQEYYRNTIEASFRNTEVVFTSDFSHGISEAHKPGYDLIITETDFTKDPFETITAVRNTGKPFLVISREASERFAVEALREGAMDFISKRNLKYGHLPACIARCLLEVPAYHKLRELKQSLPSFKESEAFTNKLREGMAVEAKEIRFRSQLGYPALPDPGEGELYDIVLLFFHLKLPETLKASFDETRIQGIYNGWMGKLEHLAGSYGGRKWISKPDAMAFAFPPEGLVPAVLAAIDLNAKTYLDGADFTLERPGVVSAITKGQCRYTRDSGNLVSEIINYAAHVIYRPDLKNDILVPDSLVEQLPVRVRNYFFKEKIFENTQLYRFERIA